MSPIISFRDDGPKPPPFSTSSPPGSLTPSSADGRRAATTLAHLDDDTLPAFSPLPSDGPSASPFPASKIKPPGKQKQPRLGARQRSGDYGGLEREDEDGHGDDAGLLRYEMDVLDGHVGVGGDGRRDSIDGTSSESVARRRERGEAIISGNGRGAGAGGWFGLRKPSPAGTLEILGIVYEVRF